MSVRTLAVFASLTCGTALAIAPASSPPPAAAEQPMHWQPGPKKIDLGYDLSLELPAAHVFLGMPDASRLLEANGAFHNEDVLGVIAAKDEKENWFVIVRYDQAGYVKDDEKIDADALLKSFREGQTEANKERVKRGFQELKIDGWSESPAYDRATHRLVWALLVSSEAHGQSVNYNTRVLGRRGYVSLNMVTQPSALAAFRGNATTLLAATSFKEGSRYQDFNAKTDKVAEYGIVGLILGGAGLGAAKLVKIGLLAKFWKVLLGLFIAGKKLFVAAIVGIGVLLKKIFGGKSAPPSPPAQASSSEPPSAG